VIYTEHCMTKVLKEVAYELLGAITMSASMNYTQMARFLWKSDWRIGRADVKTREE